LEDLTVGEVIPHSLTRTICESDNVVFSTMTMNPARLHLDRHYAEQTEFGAVLVNSMLTIGLLVGLSVLETTHGTTVANLGFERIDFPHPLFIGDTLHAETEVLAVRASESRPDSGIAHFEHRGFNQDETLVCRARRIALMASRTTRSLGRE
jgi:acyl dehydratase